MKRFQKIMGVLIVCVIIACAGTGIYHFTNTRMDGQLIFAGREEKQEAGDIQEDSSEASETSETEETGETFSGKETEPQTENDRGIIEEPETETKTETESETETEIETETETVKENGYVVGIDPGHQGSWVDMSDQEPNGPGSSDYKAKSTTGTMGRYTGVPEYQLNLDISLALREELENRGYQVVMTREDNDTAISNSERALLAAEKGSDIYVRIHANGSDDTSVKGALGMSPSPDNPYIPELYEDSYRLTGCILNAYCETTGFSNLGIQYYDNMTGINWSKIPVTILEMGFMTNEQDDTAMQDAAMQRKMVQGIADGIDDYFGIEASGIEEETEILMNGEGPVTEICEKYLSSREANGEKWAVSIESFGTKTKKIREIYEYNGQEKMQSASVIKVFIMATVYDRMCYPSSPERLIFANEAYDGELRYLLEQMITISDNDAANQLITKLGQGDFYAGAEVVNEFCEENGYTATSVGRPFLAENPSGDNYTSANDCRKILSDIYQGKCVGEEASKKMLDILRQQTNTSKIPSGLSVGEVTATANKTGEMPEGYGLGCIENDMAIIFSENGDYILTVLSNELGGRNEEAKQVIRDISSLVWNWFSEQE